VMVLIIPVDEMPAEASGVLDAAEAFRETRLIFQGFEDGVDGPKPASVCHDTGRE
jgi:hypothetical protein